MKDHRSRLTALAVPALSILFFGLADPSSAQVVVSDHGLTAPTLGTRDTGYTGAADNRFGWDAGESLTQTFTLPKAGTIAAIYLGYNGFADGDTITLTLSVNGTVVQSGILLSGNNFSGNATTDGNTGPFYWMKFDLSTMAVPVTAGSNSFTMTATANTGVSWAFAPVYKKGNSTYAGGALSLSPVNTETNSDLRFAVTIDVPLVVTSAGFNEGAFELTVSGFDTAKQYVLKRSADLADGFPTSVGSAFTPATGTQTVSDPAPPAGKAFYRVEKAP